MDTDSRVSLLAVLVLIAFAAYFAVAETSLTSVSRSRIRLLSDRGDERAKNVSYIIDNFESAISTLLVCTNITHISAATIVTVAVTRLWGVSAVTVSTFITTIFVFFAGEMLPKSVAKKNPEKYALQCAGNIRMLMKILKPISMILAKIGEFAASISKSEPEISVTEDELHDIIEDMAEEGSIDEKQEDLISSVLDFTETRTRSIYTSLEDVVGLDISTPRAQAFDFIRKQSHSRILIYSHTKQRILGILQIRKYLKKYMITGQIPSVPEMMDQAFYVPSGKPASELLKEMSLQRQNIAVVQNSRGDAIGIVSVEDILEELVGDILDEKDLQGGDQNTQKVEYPDNSGIADFSEESSFSSIAGAVMAAEQHAGDDESEADALPEASESSSGAAEESSSDAASKKAGDQ